MTVTLGPIGSLPTKWDQGRVKGKTPLIRPVMAIRVSRHIDERGAIVPEVSHPMGDQRRNREAYGIVRPRENRRDRARGGRLGPQVAQDDLKRSSRETEPVMLTLVVDPRPDGPRFGPDLIDMDDRFDRPVARGEQFEKIAALIGTGRQAMGCGAFNSAF